MAIIILPLFFSTLLLAFVGTGRYGLRQSLVYTATIYTLCLVLSTEISSISNMLIFEVLLAFWIGVTSLVVLYLRLYGNRTAVSQALSGSWTRFRASKVLWTVALVWSLILAIAIVYPPINWDSMTYHMARVAMWVQQGSIDHFPAAHLPQLTYPPLAEWYILHFQILSSGDRFANTVQWLALVNCSITASLIARELQQSFPVQVLVVVIATTLPMGLLQGSSTQNDLVVSFWLLALTLFAIQYLQSPTVSRMGFCGLALGFALLTKGTAYAITPPLAVTLLIYGLIRRPGTRCRVQLVGVAMVILGIALVLNGGHWTRNWNLFGNPLYTADVKYSNDELSIPIIWSNLIRNSALHWGVPSETLNATTVGLVHAILGDLIDTPEATLTGSFDLRIPFSRHEDYAGNFLHFWGIAFSLLGIVLFRKKLRLNALTAILALALVLAIIFYCGLLKWQIWASRLHTPLFMLGAPIVAVFISSFGPRTQMHFMKIFLIMSFPWIILNETRPIYSDSEQSILSVDRTAAYFRPLPDLLQGYSGAVGYLEAFKPKEVGINLSGYQYVYPLRVLMRQKLESMPRLEHVKVGNVSGELRDGNYHPPYIISTVTPVDNLEDVSYTVVWMSPPAKDPAVQVFVSARMDMIGSRWN